VKVSVIVGTWETIPHTKFCKKLIKGIYPFGANIYQKLPILAIFQAASPHLSNQSGKIWCEGADLGLLPKPNFVEIV